MKIYLATGNKGKVEELIPLVKKYIPFVSEVLAQAPKDADEIEETFLGNARIKSRALLKELLNLNPVYPFYVLSDDSGLEVEALGMRPGVHSARYAGDHVSAEAHIQKLLFEMNEKTNRTCRYVCALSLLKVLSPTQKSLRLRVIAKVKSFLKQRERGALDMTLYFGCPHLKRE